MNVELKLNNVKNSMYLPLHYGKAPHWLLGRMKKLAKPIVALIIEEFGEKEFFLRICDPIFFQSFSNVLGFDWNSSGTTTVLTGVLKSVLNTGDFDIRIAGGKGNEGRKTPEHIMKFSPELGVENPRGLIAISKFAAKVDNVAMQDGYGIYHHTLIFSRKYWTVIQQGLNTKIRMARRYHWGLETIPLPKTFESESISDYGTSETMPESYSQSQFIPKSDILSIREDIHSGIAAERKEKEVVNLVSDKSNESRKNMVDIVNDNCFKRDYERLLTITRYKDGITVPRRVNWKAFERAYDLQVKNFEQLIMVEGLGPGAMRALALVSDLVYNLEYDRQDPAKYCFAVGGKDGIPFPVDKKSYDEVIDFMGDALRQAKIGDFEKKEALRKLAKVRCC